MQDMRIFQVLVTLSYGDGVGNDTLAIDKILKEEGYETLIYAENIDNRISKALVGHISTLPKLSKQDVIIYHLSTGCNLNLEIMNWDCNIIFRYHNVTPPEFFAEYNEVAYNLCSVGVEQVKLLKKKAKYVLADSEFNKQDLMDYGYDCTMDVLPILIPFEDYETTPSKKVIEKYKDSWTNIVFVGRVAPNKKHEDIIKVFDYYKKYINPTSRLILVGSYDKRDKYYRKLAEYVEQLGTQDVIFTGHTKFDEILGYYKSADIFLCMSEHEGFCIPVVEAMHFQVPVVAYASTAVPYTMQNQGAIIDDKNPAYVARVIDKIVKIKKLQNRIIETQNEGLKQYEYSRVRQQFIDYLEGYLRSEQ